MTLVLFIFVNLVFFCPKMILWIKIEISRNVFYNSLGFYFPNELILTMIGILQFVQTLVLPYIDKRSFFVILEALQFGVNDAV